MAPPRHVSEAESPHTSGGIPTARGALSLEVSLWVPVGHLPLPVTPMHTHYQLRISNLLLHLQFYCDHLFD